MLNRSGQSKSFWDIILLLMAIGYYFYVFILQVLPGAMSDDLIRNFKLNAVQMGYISAAFYLSYAPLQLVLGFFLDRYEAVDLLVLMWIGAALGIGMFAVSKSFIFIIIARIIIGTAAAGAFITALYLGRRYLRLQHLALYTGGLELIGALGGLFTASGLAAWTKSFSWSKILLILSLIGIFGGGLTALCAYFTRKEEHRNRWNESTRASYLLIFKEYQFWVLGFYSLLVWGPFLVLVGLWGKHFLQIKFHLAPAQALKLLSWLWWGLAIVSLGLGSLAKKTKIKTTVLMVIISLIGALSILALLLNHLTVNQLKMVLFGIGSGAAGQTLSFIWLAERVPSKNQGIANGFNNMWVVLGGIGLPVLVSYSLDFFWSGLLKNGIRVYQKVDFVYSLSWLLFCYLGALVISSYLVYTEKMKED